jgi:hypothetical protein
MQHGKTIQHHGNRATCWGKMWFARQQYTRRVDHELKCLRHCWAEQQKASVAPHLRCISTGRLSAFKSHSPVLEEMRMWLIFLIHTSTVPPIGVASRRSTCGTCRTDRHRWQCASQLDRQVVWGLRWHHRDRNSKSLENNRKISFRSAQELLETRGCALIPKHREKL